MTVVAPDGATADSLDTAAYVLGPERGLALVEETPGASALIVRSTPAGIQTFESSGFRKIPRARPKPAPRPIESPVPPEGALRPAPSLLRTAPPAAAGDRVEPPRAGLRPRSHARPARSAAFTWRCSRRSAPARSAARPRACRRR